MDLKFGEGELIPAIVQDRLTGQVRMLAYMTREALAQTQSTGRATFFSRSRGALWEKGEQSGNTLHVKAIRADCDADALLLLVDPAGPSCHTGQPSCFFQKLEEGDRTGRAAADVDDAPTGGESPRGSPARSSEAAADAAPFLEELERMIAARRASSASKSYTRSLLDGGAEAIGGKLREEADELARAVAAETDARVVSEAADVIYHVMVALASRDVGLRAVLAALAERTAKGGHEEKAARGAKEP